MQWTVAAESCDREARRKKNFFRHTREKDRAEKEGDMERKKSGAMKGVNRYGEGEEKVKKKRERRRWRRWRHQDTEGEDGGRQIVVTKEIFILPSRKRVL